MKNLKHTPAPWKFTQTTIPALIYWFSIKGSNGDNVCKILRDDSDNLEQQTADAKLIASAPELLKALIEAKNKLVVLDNNTSQLHSAETEQLIEKIDLLIKKATE